MNVGAQGTNYLGIPTKMLADLLDTRNDYRQKSRDDAAFESMLGTSELSEADKQLARLYRHAPQIGQMVDRQQREETARKQQMLMLQQRQAQQAAAIKQRQEQQDQQQAAQAAALKGAEGSAQPGFLRPQFAPPGAQMTFQPSPSMARMGIGGPKFNESGQMNPNQGQTMAGVKVMPDDAYNMIAKHDPSNPALQGAMPASKYQEMQKAQATAQATSERRTASDEAKRVMSERQKAAIADFYENGGNSEEKTQATQLMGFMKNPEAAFKFIESQRTAKRKDEAAQAKAKKQEEKQAKAEEAKNTAASEKRMNELEKAKIDLADAKAKAGSITLSEDEKKAYQEKIGLLGDRVKRLEAGVTPPAPVASAPAALPPLPEGFIEGLKGELEDAKKSGNKQMQDEAEAALAKLKERGYDSQPDIGGAPPPVPEEPKTLQTPSFLKPEFKSTDQRAVQRERAKRFGVEGQPFEEERSRMASYLAAAKTPDEKAHRIMLKRYEETSKLVNEARREEEDALGRGDAEGAKKARAKAKIVEDHLNKLVEEWDKQKQNLMVEYTK